MLETLGLRDLRSIEAFKAKSTDATLMQTSAISAMVGYQVGRLNRENPEGNVSNNFSTTVETWEHEESFWSQARRSQSDFSGHKVVDETKGTRFA